MRWLVDVTALGKSDKESIVVDAESWQKALQAARAQRGETAPMSGFSIELLDDGCRAVDPMSRLRYEVKKAPDDHAAGSKSVPPRRASSPPAPASKKSQPSTRTMMMGSGPPGVETATATAAHVPTTPPSAPRPVSPPHAPSPVAAKADVAATAGAQIIFKREQDATDSLPLTYREYVFLVPPGTTEGAAETLLLTQIELVRASLERVAPGKLVNLGVFDLVFQGKPPVPPLATLAWKDWRGAPVVSFPRHPQPIAKASLPSAPVAVHAPAPHAHPPAPPPSKPAPPRASVPVPSVASHPPAGIIAPTAVVNVAPAHAPAPVHAPSHAPPPSHAPLPVHLQPSAPAPAPVASAPPPPEAIFPPPTSARPPSIPPPAPPPSPRTRVRGEDLIADLFEAMHDLHFVHDALEGGEFCLTLAMEKLPSQAGLVHLYDIDRREFLVASTRGAGTSKLLLRRHPENDPVLIAAMRKQRAVVVVDGAQSEAAGLERYTMLGGARSLLIAPVMLHGRFLGAIELLNPLDGQPFNDAEGNALTYIAEQFAEFISSHGIVTDPERISQRPLPEV